jgi:hypothetical protein
VFIAPDGNTIYFTPTIFIVPIQAAPAGATRRSLPVSIGLERYIRFFHFIT